MYFQRAILTFSVSIMLHCYLKFPCIRTLDFQKLFTKISFLFHSNIVRGLHAFFPPKIKHLKSYFEKGERDAIDFLERENMYEDEVPDGTEPGQENQSTSNQDNCSQNGKLTQEHKTVSCSSLQYESSL